MKLPALAGPTCCGKTPLAATLAEQLNGEIISVDAGAVYRGMEIGTATPPPAVLARVRHHLIGVVAPNEPYHVGRFVADVRACVADIQSRQKTPLLAGGTMMYFHALMNGLSPIPPVPRDVAESVAAEFGDKPQAAHVALAAADAAAARLPPTDRQRILRALSVWRATGKPLSAWQQHKPPPPFCLRLVRLLPKDREAHRRRIAERLDAMWENGLQDETRRLLADWQLPPHAPPLRLIGYRQAAAHLRGETTGEQMRRDACVATRRLAKRQMTWLRRWDSAPVLHVGGAKEEGKNGALVARLCDIFSL